MISEHLLLNSFVDVADPAGLDQPAFLRRMAHRCVQLLEVDAAMLLLTRDGPERPTAGTSRAARQLALIESEHGGPGSECSQIGAPVAYTDFGRPDARWERFTEAALQAGFAAAYALPMRFDSKTIGALTLLRMGPGGPPDRDLQVAQALADVAAASLAQRQVVDSQARLVDQLQTALSNRIVIEQAKGVLSERLGVDVAIAFEVLRLYARSHSQRLADVAAQVIAGEIALARPPK